MEESKKNTSVWVPSESFVSHPIRTRLQELPLNLLPWNFFQRLCARLAQRGGKVERCQEYGIPGQDQEGIDIYVRTLESSRYTVWQCKRYKEFSSDLIDIAVTGFLKGSWAPKTDKFVLAVSVKTEEKKLAIELESQGDRLRERNIQFLPLGVTQISEHLKNHPDLVDDFFGREWVQEFCGEEAAAKLSSRRLKPGQVVQLRQLLRRCYTHHFEISDPGIPSVTGSIKPDFQPLSLADRFVPPDILEEQQAAHIETTNQSIEDQNKGRLRTDGNEDSTQSRRPQVLPRPSLVRRSAIDWLADSDQSVVLGDPGIGKSTLLRCVLLDLLSTDPRYEASALRWGQYLPVWVPFAMWTRLVSESETGCSLANVLTAWLQKVSAETALITLVQQALEDSRLMLFVDGLDEWSNGTDARTALGLLEQFVGERNVPAIVSSRPLGYTRIGGLSSRWRVAQLSGLTDEQQGILAERWFMHRSYTLAVPGEDSDSIAMRHKRAKSEATQFIQDLHRDLRISRLAKVPLLLNGLIALAIQKVSLPRSRFKAYEELARLLLDEQPKRREKSVHARGTNSHLQQETRERALARLAWETHDSAGSDALDRVIAKDVLQGFCSTHLHKKPEGAHSIAEELLTIGTEAVGVLIEKSPIEIGFLHRSLQEFLAAKHLSNLPFEQQKEALKKRFKNPQWHDVFLCLCHLNSRYGEVDEFVAIIESMPLAAEMELSRQSFLAEVAFGDLHCSPSVARKLAEETFEIVETGVRTGTRERLIEFALDGLESEILRSHVESRIQRWFPLRHQYRHGMYESASKWGISSEGQAILMRGFIDEEAWNQRIAAESLARAYGGDPSVAEWLFDLLLIPSEPRLLACSLHALCLGWETNHRLPEILKHARSSADVALQSVALIHRVKRKEQDVDDYETLVELARDFHFASWCWKDDRIRALLKGWPGDIGVKNSAIRSIERNGDKVIVDSGAVGIILLEGFPQDDEVAEAIAGLFRTEDYPSHLIGLGGNWGPLVEAFAGHQILGLAVDDWLERKIKKENGRLFWDFELCLISRSEQAKGILLKPDEDTGVISKDQARWLLLGWGMEDKEVATALLNLADSDVAIKAAHLLPEILLDKVLCRRRLLEILNNESGSTARGALIGLVNLGVKEHDEEVVPAAIEKYSGEVPSGVPYWGVSDLIKHFPNHPKVRDLSFHQLRNRAGDLNTVANAYLNCDEIRCELLKLSSPLPVQLRLTVVDRLARLGPDDDFAYKLLSDYDEDIDVNVKTAAAIGFAASVIQRDELSSELLEKLTKGLLVIGPDYGDRRQAAFSVLLELDRLDIVKTVWSECETNDRGFGVVHSTNLRLAEHLVSHWNRITQAFGDSIWEQIGWMSDEFLTEMAAHATDSDKADEIVEQASQSMTTAPMLQLYSSQLRNTKQLRELCLPLVQYHHVGSWIETAPGIVAAEILAEQFSNDTKTYEVLKSCVTLDDNSNALVIALSAGWPDSQAWKELRTRVQAEKPKLLLPAQIQLLAAIASPNEFVIGVETRMSNLRGDIWEFLPSCLRAVAARFTRDKKVRELAFNRLETQPTSFEKLNYPSFLLDTYEQPERLRAWMRSEINAQSEGVGMAEVALDLSTGTVRSVSHNLLEHLMA